MKLLTIVLALALAAPSLGALAAPSLAFGCPGYKSGKTTCTSKTSLTGTTQHQLLPAPFHWLSSRTPLAVVPDWRWLVRVQVSVPDGGPAFVRKAGR